MRTLQPAVDGGKPMQPRRNRIVSDTVVSFMEGSSGHGGRRDGAGRPTDSKDPHPETKKAARDALRQMVLAVIEPHLVPTRSAQGRHQCTI